MSFVITVYVPEAIVMASDSRQFLTLDGKLPSGQPIRIETQASDFTFKTFLLESQRVGISTYGADFLEGISIESHIRRFSEEHLTEDNDPQFVADKLIEALGTRFVGADTGFHVGGFVKDKATSIPYVYECHIGKNQVVRRNVEAAKDDVVVYGAAWSGQPDVMSRLLNTVQVRGPSGQPEAFQGFPVLWQAMNVQDAIDFAIYAVRTTIDTMRFEARQKNVGGPVDALVLTPHRSFWAQRKRLQGEESLATVGSQ